MATYISQLKWMWQAQCLSHTLLILKIYTFLRCSNDVEIIFWLSPLVLNFPTSGPQCSVHSCSLSLAKACFCTQSVNPSLHCNAMHSLRQNKIVLFMLKLKYLTIFDRKKDEGPRNSNGFLNRYFSES